MNWNQFDKIYFIDNYRNDCYIKMKNLAKNVYKITNLENVEYLFNPKNRIINEIYDLLRRNKFLVDWYNTQYPGDFYGRDDFNNTFFMMNIIQKSYMLGYNKIFVVDLHNWGSFHKNKNLNVYLNNFPEDFNGFVLLDYKNKCDNIKNKINDYYYTSDLNNIENINVYAISRNGMRNIIDNQEMVLKKFEYYLVNRNMFHDSFVDYIFLNKE